LEAAIQGGAGCEIVLHFWAYLMQRKSPMNSELFSRSTSVDFCNTLATQCGKGDLKVGAWHSARHGYGKGQHRF
jgi:hypothetical protein